MVLPAPPAQKAVRSPDAYHEEGPSPKHKSIRKVEGWEEP